MTWELGRGTELEKMSAMVPKAQEVEEVHRLCVAKRDAYSQLYSSSAAAVANVIAVVGDA
jgi:hypothetical protein